MQTQPLHRGFLFALIAIACLRAAPAFAQVNSWTSPNAGKWETPGNWSLGIAPTNSHSAFITNAFSKTVTIDVTTATNASSTMTINNLTVSAPSSPASANTLFLDNSGLATPFRVLNGVSISNNATLLMFGSSVFEVGTASVAGSMLVEGGGFVNVLGGCFLVTTNAGVSVGNRGTGFLTINSSTWLANGISVGGLQGSTGTLTLQSGTNIYTAFFDLGTNPGATGNVLIAGGQLVATNVFEARLGSFGQGRIVITNGLMRLGNAALGRSANARGTLTISNGTFSAATLTLAPLLGTTGTVTMVGGTFTADRLVATNTAGVINFLGGDMTLRGAEIANNTAFFMGSVGRTAALNFPAGTNRFQLGFVIGPAGGSGATNTVLVSGGHWVVTNGTTTIGDSALGQVTLSNGSWRARDVNLGRDIGSRGTLVVAGGEGLIFSNLNIGVQAGTGIVFVTGGQLVVTNAITTVGLGGVGQMTVFSNTVCRLLGMSVGFNAGSRGTFTVDGGSPEFVGGFNIGENAGATGSVSLVSGSLVVTNPALESVVGLNGIGQMAVSNGLFRAHDFRVGRNAGSRGTLTIVGGTNVMNSFLSLGTLAGANGTLLMTAGQLLVTNNIISVAGAGIGSMTISNGAVQTKGVTVGGQGTFRIAGGTLEADQFTATTPGGSIQFSGGTMTWHGSEIANLDLIIGRAGKTAVLNLVAGTNHFAGDFAAAGEIGSTGIVFMTSAQLTTINGGMFAGLSGAGQITISDGTCQAFEAFVGSDAGANGTLTIAGGANVINTKLDIGSTATATGTVQVTSGQLLVTNGATSVGKAGVGRMTVSNGTWRAREVSVGAGTGAQATLTIAGGTSIFSSTLSVAANAGATGTVWMTGGQLTVTNNSTRVGDSGVGQMTVSNGTCRVFEMVVGDNPGAQGALVLAGGTNIVSDMLRVAVSGGATGTVGMTGGQLIVTNGVTQVGDGGVGQLTVSNGTWQARDIVVGNNAGSHGTLAIAGGVSTLAGNLTVAANQNSTGTVSLTGGQLIVTNSSTRVGNSGVGQMTASGGTWLARDVAVGRSAGSRGTLTISGGTNLLSSTLQVAQAQNSTGSVFLTGGRLVTTNINPTIGVLGVGQMTVSNGAWQVGSLVVGGAAGSKGTLTIASGSTTLGLVSLGDSANATGTVLVTGGQLNNLIGSALIGNFGVGQMTVSSGAWRAGDAFSVFVGFNAGSRGTLTIAGGMSSIGSSLTLGTSGCTATGSVTVAGGDLTVTNSLTNAVLEVRSGTLTINSGTLRVDRIVITNSCAHFVRTGGTLIYNTPPVLNPNEDTDGDGFSNQDELNAGSDPLDANSLPVAGQLSVTPATLVFDTIATGMTAQASFVVTNLITGAFTGSVTVASGPFAVVSGSPFDLGVGGSTNVVISFTPTAHGTVSNDVSFTSSGGNSTNIVIGTGVAFPPGDVNGTNGVTGADSLLINQVLVNLRSSNDVIFAVAGYANGDVNATNGVTGADSLLINQVLVGLRSYMTTRILPGSHSSNETTAVVIFGVRFPTNSVPTVTIGAPVNLALTNITVLSRERITAMVPPGGGLGTGTVNVISSPTNGVISFGRFINQ